MNKIIVTYVIKVGNLYILRKYDNSTKEWINILVDNIENATHFNNFLIMLPGHKKGNLHDIADQMNGKVMKVTNNYSEEFFDGVII